MKHYTVTADRETGEWRDDLTQTGEVVATEWHKKDDTDSEHYDTFESDGETCAITVRWTDE